jgi:hypothetical protein
VERVESFFFKVPRHTHHWQTEMVHPHRQRGEEDSECCFLRHIGAAGFRVKRAGVKKRGLAGHVWGMHDSTFASPEPVGELQRWDKIVIMKLGRKRVYKLQQQKERYKLVLFWGFEPVQNFILLVGT